MTRSIRFKMALALMLILSFIIGLMCFVNSTFSASYYEMSERSLLKDTYKRMEGMVAECNSADPSSVESLLEEVDRLSNKTNIKMIFANYDNYIIANEPLYNNMFTHGREYMHIVHTLIQLRALSLMSERYSQDGSGQDKESSGGGFSFGLPGFMFGRKEKTSFAKDGYVIEELHDRTTDQTGLYLMGFLGENYRYIVAMRVSMDGIAENAAISSRFIGIIGLVGIVLGWLTMFIYAASFTKPIKKMANVANRMAHLDFDARVDVKRKDELGELGRSMNEMSEKLETAITDLKSANLELQRDIEKKQEIDDMRKEFLSHVSHELKTPIALIQGYAEGLQDNVNDSEEDREFYCEVICDEAKKMNEMVRRLLDLNQIEFGNEQLNIQRFDICQLIENKINSSQILFARKNAQVYFEEEGPVEVWADELMIEEVFSNYLSNARNHVPEGGRVRIWFEKIGTDLRVHVYNEGDQIPEEELDKLWIKFYKVDKARTREYGGNGIGLSIVAAAMKAHGKDYGVINAENGVDFYFDLDMKGI